MTALMRAADRVAGTAPGWPRRLLLARRAELVFLLRGSPAPCNVRVTQCQCLA